MTQSKNIDVKIEDAKYKGFIFDLDGTVADTLEDITNAVNLTRKSFGFDEINEEESLKHINFGVLTFISGCFPESCRDEKTLREALVRYTQFYSENFIEKTYAFDGIQNLLKTLYECGFKICILSNKQDKLTKAIVRGLFASEYFTEVLGASERFPHKPEPTSALYLAEQMGISSRDIIFIGDSNIDMETAVNAGMFAVGVSWGYRSREVLEKAGAQLIINEPQDLINFLNL